MNQEINSLTNYKLQTNKNKDKKVNKKIPKIKIVIKTNNPPQIRLNSKNNSLKSKSRSQNGLSSPLN